MFSILLISELPNCYTRLPCFAMHSGQVVKLLKLYPCDNVSVYSNNSIISDDGKEKQASGVYFQKTEEAF